MPTEVVCRSCGGKRVFRYVPTFTFVCGVNDPMVFENEPKGPEKYRLLPMYFPNKFIDEGEEPSSPRTHMKDITLEDKVKSTRFAVGHLLNLVAIRQKFSSEGQTVDESVRRGTPTSKFWLEK